MRSHCWWWFTESVRANPAKRRRWTSGAVSRRSVLHIRGTAMTWSRNRWRRLLVHCSKMAKQELKRTRKGRTMLFRIFGNACTTWQQLHEITWLQEVNAMHVRLMRLHKYNSDCTVTHKSNQTRQHVRASLTHVWRWYNRTRMRNKAKIQTLDCTRNSRGFEGLWIPGIFSIMERNVTSSFQNDQQNLHISRKVKHLKVCALRRCTAMGVTSAISYVHLGSFVHATARRSSQDTNVIQWFGWWLKPKTFGVPKKRRYELQTRNEMISITDEWTFSVRNISWKWQSRLKHPETCNKWIPNQKFIYTIRIRLQRSSTVSIEPKPTCRSDCYKNVITSTTKYSKHWVQCSS
jgi:hypothetical protein